MYDNFKLKDQQNLKKYIILLLFNSYINLENREKILSSIKIKINLIKENIQQFQNKHNGL
jgi:hypothetical protein